jgi:hypothetical protein
MAQQSTKFKLGDRVVDAWGNDVDPDEEAPDYSKMSAKELKAEIDRRNADRAEEDHIVLEGTKKSDAVAALEADDEAHADDEEE